MQVEDGWITGLVYKKYHCTLQDAVEKELAFDLEKVVADVRAGIEHMHSLGLVHVRQSERVKFKDFSL